MKRFLRLAVAVLFACVLAGAQTNVGVPSYGNVGVLLDQTFTAGAGTSAPVIISSGQFAGMVYLKVEFTPTNNSNITSCTVAVDSQVGGAGWVFGGAIAAQTCTSAGSQTGGPVNANQIAADISVSGTGSVRVRILGALSTFATAGSGTITGVVAGTGLSGGGISGGVTLNLANTAVTPGSYTSANINVDAQGRITLASNGSGGTFQANSTPLSSSSTINFINSAVINGVTLTFANPGGAGNVQLGMTGAFSNAALTNSTISIGGTANQITSSNGAPALGGTTTLAIANPFIFPGKATTAASASGGAGFNLPHGAAPTSPVNGDTWTTTAGLFIRINGVTIGPYGIGTITGVTAGTGLTGGGSSGGVTVGISAPIATSLGGTGTISTLTGLVRGGAAYTATELSGDAITSGSNVVTVSSLHINGVAYALSASLASGQCLFAATSSTIGGTSCGSGSLPSGAKGAALVNTTGGAVYATTGALGYAVDQFAVPYTTGSTAPSVDATATWNSMIAAVCPALTTGAGCKIALPPNSHFYFAPAAGTQIAVPLNTDGIELECPGGPGPQQSSQRYATSCSMEAGTAGIYILGSGEYGDGEAAPNAGPHIRNITFIDATTHHNAGGAFYSADTNDATLDNISLIQGFRQTAIAAPSAPTCTASNAGGSVSAGATQVELEAWTTTGPTVASAATTCASSPITGSTGSVSIVIPSPAGAIIGYEALCKIGGAASFVTCSPLPTYTANGDGSLTLNVQSATPLVVTANPTSTRGPSLLDTSHSGGVAFFGSNGWAGNQGFSNGPRITNEKCFEAQGCVIAGRGAASVNVDRSELSSCDASATTGLCESGAGGVATPGTVIGFAGLRLTNTHFTGYGSLADSTGVSVAVTGFNNLIIGGTMQDNTSSLATGISLVSATRTVVKGLLISQYNVGVLVDANSKNNEVDFLDDGTNNTVYTDSGTGDQWWRAGIELVLNASTSTSASFNIPPGTAPASPVNGDIWATSAGVYAQVNGGTVGPFGTGAVTIQTNTVNNAVQTTLNFLNSTTNAAGLTVTASNSTSTEKFEITGTVNATSGGTGIDSHTSTGVAQLSGGTWSVSTALANGTTATTQSPGDNTTKVATDAFVIANAAGLSGLTTNGILYATGATAATTITPPAVNGAYSCGYSVTASATVVPTCNLPGIPIVSETGASDTLLYSYRGNYLDVNGGTTFTLTLPAIGTGNIASNLPFILQNLDSGNTTVTSTSPNAIDGGSAGGSITVLPKFAAFIYQDAAGPNWFSLRVPTFAAFGSTCTNGLTWSTTTGIGCLGSAAGTVTSVAETVPSGFAIGGSPITTSGTLAITYSVSAAGQIINSTGSNAAGFTPTATLGAQGTTAGSLTIAGTTGTSGSLVLNGSTSGSATLNVTATAGTLNLGSTNATVTSAGAFTGASFTATASGAGYVSLTAGAEGCVANQPASSFCQEAAAAITTAYHVIWPAAVGTSNQVLNIASVTGQAITLGWGNIGQLGIPSDVTGQSTSQTTVTVVSSTPAAGNYTVKYYLDQNATCATPGSGQVLLTFNWTDATHARAISTVPLAFTSAATTTGFLQGSMPIFAASASAITYTSTVVACGAGTATYDVHVLVQ